MRWFKWRKKDTANADALTAELDNTESVPEEIVVQPEKIIAKFKRRYRFFQISFFMLIALYGVTIYFNYDYWIFKFLIANNYVFTDALDTLYSQHLLEENRRSFHRDFDRVVISVVTGQLSAINNDRFTYLYSPQHIQAVRQMDVVVAQRATVHALNEDTVYLYIPNISRITREFVHDNSEYMAQYANLVLDLRGNYGGWLIDFQRIADLFVPRGAVLGYEDTRMNITSRTITSSNDQFFYFDNVIILQNRRTASAAESLILALRYHVPNVVLLGETTFGKGIGQVTIPLTGGYAVRATVLHVLGPGRESIHLTGINPCIVACTETDMIEQALALIN